MSLTKCLIYWSLKNNNKKNPDVVELLTAWYLTKPTKMLTSIARSCVRNGRRVSVHAACLPPVFTVKNSPNTLDLPGTRHLTRQRSSGPLTPAAWLQILGLATRSMTLSATSLGDADPLGSPSTRTDPAQSSDAEDSVFGSLSADLSSRRSFRKSSPDIRDHVGEDGEVEEREADRPHRKPGRRNTQYWYFLQCKKLIKENKVSAVNVLSVLCCPPSSVFDFLSAFSCRRLWMCLTETCCKARGCSRRSSTTVCS